MNNIKIFKELLIEYIKENEDNERNKKKIDATYSYATFRTLFTSGTDSVCGSEKTRT